MIKTILITGGTGLVGNHLVKELLLKGYRINLLTRKPSVSSNPDVSMFKWDVYKREIDKNCIAGVDAIIHLAGESIAGGRWTEDRKRQIRESRTESIRMIYNLFNQTKNQVSHVISASAIGYYGDRGDEILKEESLPAKDFLADTCIEWEQAVDEGSKRGLRIVKLRSGVILDKEEGALKQMAMSMKMGIGTILGSGKQWISWIHIRDVVNMYIFALENESLSGPYNMAAPSPVNNRSMIQAIAAARNKSVNFIHVPDFALKLIMGEMSRLVLSSTRVSPEKIIKAGFQFAYPTIEGALKQIYSTEN